MNDAFRTEKDAMGEVRVPADRLWGAQTQRSIGNFPIGVPRFRWDRPVIRAFGIVKLAAARANAKLGVLAADKAQLIERARALASRGERDRRLLLQGREVCRQLTVRGLRHHSDGGRSEARKLPERPGGEAR